MQKSRAEIFDITTSKDQQRLAEMRMTGALDLTDLAVALSKDKSLPPKDDGIEWIELKWERPASENESV
jgi:hypothetical protein